MLYDTLKHDDKEVFMQIITNNARIDKYYNLSSYFNPEELLIFDIETTGFAAEASKLYLIGCCFYNKGNWTISQWFNDDGNSESDILTLFMEFTKSYKYLLHYNGDGFDIPYLTKKINEFNLDYSFSHMKSIDLYKVIKPYKSILHIDNLKQKSLEKYLGINRLDKYSGGDLIKVYDDYLKTKKDSNKQLLLQHNFEDLEGFISCCSFMSLDRLKKGDFIVKKMSVRDSKLVFSIELAYEIPKRISFGHYNIIITGYKNEVSINVPIIEEELKFYLDNYKDYYYLPAEDVAVHKSVATYVDKNYRVQAKKETCYLKRKGYFITQINKGILSGYKRNIKDVESFIELSDSFLKNMDLINLYARHIIKMML